MIRLTGPDQVAAIIADLRALERVTQRELASRTGFNQRQISRWEGHGGRPNVASLIRIAAALDYDLALVPCASLLPPDRRLPA